VREKEMRCVMIVIQDEKIRERDDRPLPAGRNRARERRRKEGE